MRLIESEASLGEARVVKLVQQFDVSVLGQALADSQGIHLGVRRDHACNGEKLALLL